MALFALSWLNIDKKYWPAGEQGGGGEGVDATP